MNLSFGSVCSGIEAASLAFEPIGWECAFVSEIEPFPQAVLRHHYGANVVARSPKRKSISRKEGGVINFGDFTAIRPRHIRNLPNGKRSADVICGGTPCQAFSIAGLRKGMDDPRANLSLAYCKLVRGSDARWSIWENVPGVLSINEGEDFRSIVSGLAGWEVPIPEDGWKNSGIITAGPGRRDFGLAWRVLDAQYTRVDGFPRATPQQRRRVVLVGYLGDWRPAAAVLFESESLRGNNPPKREARTSASALTSSGVGVGGPDVEHARAGHIVAEEPTVTARMVAFGEYVDDGTASAIKARDYKDATDLIAFSSKDYGADASPDASPTLRAGGHDKSHPNSGVPPAIAFAENSRGEVRAIGRDGKVASSLSTGGGKPGQGMPAVAFDLRGREEGVRFEGPKDAASIRAASGGSSRSYVMQRYRVRRLTPRECERLQAMPDDYTLIPEWAGRTTPPDLEETARWILKGNADLSWEEALVLARHPDGPRYKAIGNSWAVNVFRWIGLRINAVEEILQNLEGR